MVKIKHPAAFFSMLLLVLLGSGCDATKSIAVGIKNAESYALDGRYRLQGSYPADVGRFSAILPGKTVIAHIELEEPHSVYLEYKSKDQREYAGELTALAPDVPVKVMLFSVGDEYHVIGWVDTSVEGTIDIVTFRSEQGETKSKRAGTNPASRVFQFPIYAEDKWGDINGLRIRTIEASLQHSRNGQKPINAWEMEFSPPLSYEKMKETAIPIDLE